MELFNGYQMETTDIKLLNSPNNLHKSDLITYFSPSVVNAIKACL